MKNRRMFLMPFLGLLLAGFWLIWESCQSAWGYTPSFTTTTLNFTGTTTYLFDIQGIPAISDAINADGIEKDLNVFFSPGDGTFWQGTKDVFDTKQFAYNRVGSFSPFAELTSVYDDDKNPTGKVAPSGPVNIGTSNLSSNPPLRQNLSSKQVQLLSNREPKAGDSLLYIITYENNACEDTVSGSLTLHFDDGVLNFLDKTSHVFFGETYGLVGSGVVQILYSNLLPNEQRSCFMRFKVEASAAQGDPFSFPSVEINGSAGRESEPCLTDTSNLKFQKIVNSHDPNHKSPAIKKICETDKAAVFTVTFQNDGTGPTDSVIVSDELDIYLKDAFPTPVSWSTKAAPTVRRKGARKYEFVFKPLWLRGLHENGYGTGFGEDSTRATFTFSCPVNDGFSTDFPSCNGVINRAKIYFDCNAPIITEDAIIPLACTGCDDCIASEETIVLPDTLKKGNVILSGNSAAKILQEGWERFHWYPASDVQAPTVLATRFVGISNNRLTLIASKGMANAPKCQRKVFHFVFSDPCHLKIQVDASNVTPGICAGESTGHLLATVSGSSGKVRWSDCTNNLSANIPILKGIKLYVIGVTDLQTGCYLETTYKLTEGPALHVDDIPGNCQAKLMITGGTPPYSANWAWTNPSGQPFTGTGTMLNLAQKTNATVTVTDNKGCTAVFRPIYPGNCKSKWSNWAIFSLLGLAVLVVWFLLKGKKFP